MREACWSPAMPAIGGAPDSVWPSPTVPGRVDDGRAGPPRGSAGRPGARSLHPDPSPWISPVTPALEASVTCSSPSDRIHATQVSMVPKASSPRSDRDRSGSATSRMAASLVADALGAIRMPWPWSSRQVPTVRRSCQPSPGADRLPGGPVPHQGRRPLVGDPDGGDRPAVGQAAGRPPRPPRRRWPGRRTRPDRGTGCPAAPGRGGCARRWRRGGPPRPAPPTCRRRRPGCSWPGHRPEGRWAGRACRG